VFWISICPFLQHWNSITNCLIENKHRENELMVLFFFWQIGWCTSNEFLIIKSNLIKPQNTRLEAKNFSNPENKWISEPHFISIENEQIMSSKKKRKDKWINIIGFVWHFSRFKTPPRNDTKSVPKIIILFPNRYFWSSSFWILC